MGAYVPPLYCTALYCTFLYSTVLYSQGIFLKCYMYGYVEISGL